MQACHITFLGKKLLQNKYTYDHLIEPATASTVATRLTPLQAELSCPFVPRPLVVTLTCIKEILMNE
jgi:hypothetical protein